MDVDAAGGGSASFHPRPGWRLPQHDDIVDFGPLSPPPVVPVVHPNKLSASSVSPAREGDRFATCFAAGAIASFPRWVLVPLDVVKCRMQVDRAAGGAGLYAGPIDCVRQVWRQEGLRSRSHGP